MVLLKRAVPVESVSARLGPARSRVGPPLFRSYVLIGPRRRKVGRVAVVPGMPCPKRVGRWLGLIVIVTIGVNYLLTQQMESGVRQYEVGGQDQTFRLIREFLIWGLAVVMLNGIVASKRASGRVTLAIPVALASMAVSVSVVTSLLEGEQPVWILAGLRIVPLLIILAGLAHYPEADRLTIGSTVLRAATVFLLVEAIWAARQINDDIPAIFGTTFAGPRPYGTLATPNLLGMAALGVLVLTLIVRPRHGLPLVLLTLAVIFVSGSRASMLGALATLLGARFGSTRGRWLLAPYGLALLYVALHAANDEALSGRVITGEGRFSLWAQHVRTAMQGPLDWIFGAGVGYGANAVRTLNGVETTAAVTTDSMFMALLLAFGLCGLIAVVAGLFHLARRMTPAAAWTVLPPALLVALTVNLPEIAPFNVLALVAAAVGLRDLDRSRGLEEDPRRDRPSHSGAGVFGRRSAGDAALGVRADQGGSARGRGRTHNGKVR